MVALVVPGPFGRTGARRREGAPGIVLVSGSVISSNQGAGQPGGIQARPRNAWWLGIVRLVVIGVILGWVYEWVGPRLYPEGTRFGFFRGMAHGACMPLALPALVMGHDVPIYSESNTGRSYKLGYIAGINLCGLVFFGGAFWKPSRRTPTGEATNQNHQLR